MSETDFLYGYSSEEERRESELMRLRELWLGQLHDPSRPSDQKNFIRYAVKLAQAERPLDFNELKDRGISLAHIREYQRLYDFLRTAIIIMEED